MARLRFVAIPFLLVAVCNASLLATTYDVVVAGLHCTQDLNASMECEYQVGNSLNFSVVGVGDRDAAITFFAVSFDGDYYATVGVQHGCVIVKPGKLAKGNAMDFAFVSPRTGKVYKDWISCANTK